MSSIVDVIAEKTSGKSYRSYKYCIDEELRIPQLSYENNTHYTIVKDRPGENANKLIRDLSSKARQIQQISTPIFKYFLDGSRRVYKVDDLEYNRHIYPMIGGQIGVACCERPAVDQFRPVQLEKHLVLALPNAANSGSSSDSLFFNNLTNKINDIPRLERLGVNFSTVLDYPSTIGQGNDQKPENRGIAMIQSMMIELEKKVVSDLTRKSLLNQDNYLLKDGSLEYKLSGTGDFKDLSKIKNNYRWVVGASKLFNPELIKDNSSKSLASTIADLPLHHRTSAFRYENNLFGDVVFSVWYVRIRNIYHTPSPFGGVLKIEKMLLTETEKRDGLDTDEVDLITANIINESHPVCYGKDRRWANHLYPIYLTESYLKCQYLSDLFFLNLF